MNWDRDGKSLQMYKELGLKVSVWGEETIQMSRDELLVVIGVLDEMVDDIRQGRRK